MRYIAATLYRILLQKDQYTNVRIIIFPALHDHVRISSKLHCAFEKLQATLKTSIMKECINVRYIVQNFVAERPVHQDSNYFISRSS